MPKDTSPEETQYVEEIRESGGRFSRRRKVIRKYSDPVWFFKNRRPRGISARRDFRQAADEAAEFLRAQKLPDKCPVYWFYEKGVESWTVDAPDINVNHSGGTLEGFIIDDFGFDRDSFEGLAARIITNVRYVLGAERNMALWYAMKLGEALTLHEVYSAVNYWQTKPRVSKRNTELLLLVDHLLLGEPNAKPAEFFRALPLQDSKPLEIRDGSRIIKCSREEGSMKRIIISVGSGFKKFSLTTFRDYVRFKRIELKETT